MPHLPGNVDNLIKSDIFIVLNVFLPLSVSMSSPTVSGDRLRGPISGGTNFPTGAPQVHRFYLAGVEFRRHGGGSWCQMNLDLRQPKKAAPLPPPSKKPTEDFRAYFITTFLLNVFVLYRKYIIYIPLHVFIQHVYYFHYYPVPLIDYSKMY